MSGRARRAVTASGEEPACVAAAAKRRRVLSIGMHGATRSADAQEAHRDAESTAGGSESDGGGAADGSLLADVRRVVRFLL